MFSPKTLFSGLSKKEKIILCAFILAELVLGIIYISLRHKVAVYLLPVVLTPALGLVRLRPKSLISNILTYCALAGSSMILSLLLSWLIHTQDSDLIHRYQVVMNCLIYGLVFCLVYVLSGRIKFAAVTTVGLSVALEIGNEFILQFRGSDILPADYFAIGAGLNVASQYSPHWYPHHIAGIMLFLFFACFCVITVQVKPQKYFRLSAILFLVAGAFVFMRLLPLTSCRQWSNEGSQFNGLPLNLAKGVVDMQVKKPDNYTPQTLSMLDERYAPDADNGTRRPNIVVVMNESFTDLSIYDNGNWHTDQEMLPFFRSLRENTIHGYAQSSIYGGSTVNSEYEFLTGNTMAFFMRSVLPYHSYVRHDNTLSLVSQMQQLGYHTTAIHPNRPSVYLRGEVYRHLGFDSTLFADAFPNPEKIRNRVSDLEVYRKITDIFEAKETGSPSEFIMSVTIQNHGGYEIPDYSATVHIQDAPSPMDPAEQYLSLLQESDRALEYLISYFTEYDEDTVILFYGDHQPMLPNDYLRFLYGSSVNVGKDQIAYTIPFFIWANYDISPEEVPVCSINYLPNYLLDAAGLPKTGYQNFLAELQESIPAINALGFYSRQAQAYKSFEDASENEAQIIEYYRILQYRNMFGSR